MHCNYDYRKYQSSILEASLDYIRNHFYFIDSTSITIYNNGTTFYTSSPTVNGGHAQYYFCPHSLELIHFLWGINNETRKSVCKYLDYNCENREQAEAHFMAKILGGK